MKKDETQETDETRDAETRNIDMEHLNQHEAYVIPLGAPWCTSTAYSSAKQHLGVSASERRWRVGNSQLQSKTDAIRRMNCSCLG